MPYKGSYQLVFDSDAKEFGGSGTALKAVKAEEYGMHGFEQSVVLTLPPLSVQYYRLKKRNARKADPEPAAEEKPKKSRAKKAAAKPAAAEKPKKPRAEKAAAKPAADKPKKPRAEKAAKPAGKEKAKTRQSKKATDEKA